RQRLEGEQGRAESTISDQIVRQVRLELEEVLQILRR
ncbi:MAG TPA: MerR family transcriptional regulator, partial [Candidatus Saccharimonadia bacterium]|nr:MerR family transcriptional regulator [Candidatus Saccharimonadia bacterium]